MKTNINKMMKAVVISTFVLFSSVNAMAQGWPSNYGGVMLQGFYWDSFDDSQWTVLESQADELSKYFSLVWIPQSGNCGGTSMGYDDLYWFTDYESSFGTKEELISMIKTFKQKGIGTIADVVINHRKNLSTWVDFPTEVYNGVTYSMGSTDICANDDGGTTKTWATANGYSLSSNNDTGEDWGGMRDLDHNSSNVQTCVKAYLNMLINDLGYTGFRYDMVKGYSASFTGAYNTDAKPEFSVGECWDGTDYIKNWIDGTSVNGTPTSAAFDFQFRYTVRNAANSGAWAKLNAQNDGNWPLVSKNYNDGAYRRWAVTFVENHDTERRASDEQDPLKKDTLAANAYLLAMPGTPCVFMTHWMDCKNDIKKMIDVRKLCGITNESSYSNLRSSAYYCVNRVTGNNADLVVTVGSKVDSYTPADTYVMVLDGYHYRYYVSNTLETAWVDLSSGSYTTEQTAMMTAVTAQSDAQLVYTTDGSTPTASSTKASSGTKITIPFGTTTLKVGLLIGGTVKGVVTREYVIAEEEVPELSIPDFCTVTEDEVSAFFEAPATWKKDVYCWAWSNSPADNFTYANGNWPGVKCEELGTADDGLKVWKWTWDGTKQKDSSATQPGFIIFSNNGTPQTADFTFTNHGYYTIDGYFDTVTATTGISTISADENNNTNNYIYDLQGRRLKEIKGHGIFIINGKKVVK